MRCKYCSHEMKEDAEFCPRCGMYVLSEDACTDEQHSNTAICPSCGAETGANAIFCPVCGEYMEANSDAIDGKGLNRDADDSDYVDEDVLDETEDTFNDSSDDTIKNYGDTVPLKKKKHKLRYIAIGIVAVFVIFMISVYMLDGGTRSGGKPKASTESDSHKVIAKDVEDEVSTLDKEPDDGTKYYGGGAGTKEDPYIISSAEHFLNIWRHPDKAYRQTDRINLSNSAEQPDFETQVNVGLQAGEIQVLSKFEGIYDGGQNSIIGVKIGDGGTGVFPHSIFGINYGVISNVNIFAAELRKEKLTEETGFIASVNRGVIESSYVREGYMYVSETEKEVIAGGIAGYNDGGSILKCAVISSSLDCLVGNNKLCLGSISGLSTGNIKECAAMCSTIYGTGNDTIDYVMVGGIVGENGGSISDSLNYSSVRSYNTHYVSGIAGYNDELEDTIIERCFTTSSVRNEGNIRNSTITAYNGSTVTDCYYTGDILFGIAGGNDGDITKLEDRPVSDSSQDGKNEEFDSIFNEGNSRIIESYENFDFDNVWKLYDGFGVPVLKVLDDYAIVEELLNCEPLKSDYMQSVILVDPCTFKTDFAIFDEDNDNTLYAAFTAISDDSATKASFYDTGEVLTAFNESKAEGTEWNRKDLYMYLPGFTDYYRYDENNYQDIGDKYGGKRVSVAYVDENGEKHRLKTDLDFEIEIYMVQKNSDVLYAEGKLRGIMMSENDESKTTFIEARFSIRQ